MKCWNCGNEMKFIEEKEVQIKGGHVEEKKYSCSNCNKIAYSEKTIKNKFYN